MEALDELKKAQKKEPDRHHGVFLMAMLLHELGQTEQSRDWYDQAVQYLRGITPSRTDLPLNTVPHFWLQLHAHYREATALLGLDPDEELLKAKKQK
jgi:Tfp pilus assembly protein PilF